MNFCIIFYYSRVSAKATSSPSLWFHVFCDFLLSAFQCTCILNRAQLDSQWLTLSPCYKRIQLGFLQSNIILPRLCATAQQSYYNGANMHRPSVRSSNPFSRKPLNELTLNLDKWYLSTTSPKFIFFVVVLAVEIVTFRFFATIVSVFFLVSMHAWDHMGGKFQATSCLKIQSRYTSQSSCMYTPREGLC